jgi:anti-anti-sigma factor
MTAGAEPPPGFGVEAMFSGEQAVLRITGEPGTPGAARLAALFGAVLASGCSSVVLEVADLEFVDVALLQVIAYAASQIVAHGGALTIRSPSVKITRTLDITWLGGRVSLDLPRAVRNHLAAEQPAPDAGTGFSIDGQLPVHTSNRRSAVAPDQRVLDQALGLVVELAEIMVAGADGVSVSLRRLGRLTTVAASNDTVVAMDHDQYTTGEGPCVDASVNGRWFHAESLDQETRWPAFTPRAKSLGINAILSNPLMAHGKPVGALNIYSHSPAAFGVKEQALAATFATKTSALFADPEDELSDVELAWRQRDALQAREVIALAQGVIMVREGVDQERATKTLRRSSRRSGKTVREQAEDVVASARWSEAPAEPRRRATANAEWSAGGLEQARRDAGIAHGELWLRYFGLGGMCNAHEVEAFVLGASRPSAHDHDLITQALSERQVELDRETRGRELRG